MYKVHRDITVIVSNVVHGIREDDKKVFPKQGAEIDAAQGSGPGR